MNVNPKFEHRWVQIKLYLFHMITHEEEVLFQVDKWSRLELSRPEQTFFFSKMSERSMGKNYFTVLASFDSRKISVMDRINDFSISY